VKGHWKFRSQSPQLAKIACYSSFGGWFCPPRERVNSTGTGISVPYGIAAGPDGAQWFTNVNNNSIGRITTPVTKLVATPAVIGLSPLSAYLLTLHATLTATGSLVAGQKVSFTAGTTPLCTATTSSKGSATCTVLTSVTDDLAIIKADGYHASFAGDSPNYLPSSASAGLIG
jgi:hypothetical protein